MKIAIILNDISGNGGVERVVVNTANSFSTELNYSVDIISVINENGIIKYAINDNVSLIYLNNKNISSINRSKKMFLFFSQFRKVLEQNCYDIILCTSVLIVFFALINKMTSKKFYSRLIAWEHSQYDNITWLFKIIRTISYRFLYSVVTLSENDKNIFLKLNSKTVCIRNFINSSRSDITISEECPKKLISVGRLEVEKGFDYLIRACNDVFRENIDWTLTIYGDGSERNNLLKLIDSYGLTEKIIIEGFTTQIQEKYMESSIFVLSSRTESFGMALVEAMSNGLACVSFDCKVGPREIIDDGINGILVPAGNVCELSKAINLVIRDTNLRMLLSKNALKKSKQFNRGRILREWDNFLSLAMKNT